MDPDRHLQALVDEGRAFAGAAEGHLDGPVPPCPEWNVGGLVHHLGVIHRWVAATAAAGGERVQFERPPRPDDADLLPWFRAGHEELVAALSVDPDTKAWTFSPLGAANVGWWRRRQALETAVHRWDAQSATTGRPDPIEPALAVEGIDEVLLEFVGGHDRGPIANDPIDGLTGSLHLHSTDADGEWLVDLDARPPVTRREHAKADTALRGPASGLYLWLWNRQTPDQAGLEVFGSTEVVEAWRNVKL